VIQQSGSVLCAFGLSRYARAGAYVLRELLDITTTTNSTIILRELRKINAEVLRKNALKAHRAVSNQVT